MKVTVIIPTYFHEEYIDSALESVLEQNIDFALEIIVCDDASKDKTLLIVNDFAERYPEIIKVISRDSNVGTTQNIYEAFVKASGDYICLLAGDDFFCDCNKLRKQVNYLNSHEECFAVATAINCIYTDGEFINSYPDEEYLGKYFKREYFTGGISYPNHGIMFRNKFDMIEIRNAFHIMVEYSKYIDDLVLCLLYFDFGKVYILPDITYSFRVRRPDSINQHNYNSITTKLDKLSEHVNLIEKMRKYYGYKINFDGMEAPFAWELFCESIKLGEFKYLKQLVYIPKRILFKSAINYLNDKFVK